MLWIIVFIALWLVMSFLGVLGLAAVPSSTRVSNRDLVVMVAICAAIAALLTLLAVSAASLFS